jgi:hypothetical protein
VPVSQKDQSQHLPGLVRAVGIKEVDDGIWLVSFMDYDLGYIDLEEKTLQQSLRAKSVTYVLGTICYLCVRSGQTNNGAGGRTRTYDLRIMRPSL